LRYINALLIGFVLLSLMGFVAHAAEEEQSGSVEILEIVALVSVIVATVLAIMVALRMGGEMGNALKVIAVGLLGIDTLREILVLMGYDTLSEYSEIIGSVIMLAGFYLLYKATK
jgi:hypothetical protein